MDSFLAAGWSPNALMNALSPEPMVAKNKVMNPCPAAFSENTNPNFISSILSEAGWSPDALLAAISPLPDRHISSKRCKKWVTPESAKVLHPRKTFDTKKTPSPNSLAMNDTIIDLTSPRKEMNSDHEIISLSSKLAAYSISNRHIEKTSSHPANPTKFQTAKTLFIDDSTSSSLRLGARSIDSHRDEYITGARIEINSDDVNDKYKENWYQDIDLTAPLQNGWRLFDYQQETIKTCLQQRRSILALDMGLGKTIISLVWAREMCRHLGSGTPLAVVVAPCTLLETWKREATMLGFRCIDKLKDIEYSRSTTIRNITGSEDGPLLLLISWAKIPTATEVMKCGRLVGQSSCNYVLMCDEAHAMQSLKSQRTRDALALCSNRACQGVLLATGTPMKNGRPCNIFPLLLGIRHPLAANRMSFETRYCDAKKTRFSPWDISGASNLQELQEKIGPVLIRRTKEECLDLPPLIRCRVRVEISASAQREYEEIIRSYKQRKVRAQQQGRTDSTALEMMAALRQLTSAAKVIPTAHAIEKLLFAEPNSPVVVFVWFRDSARALVEALANRRTRINATCASSSSDDRINAIEGSRIRCDVISGDIVHQSERQRIIDSFQHGDLDVIICTYGVGCVGLTLTRSHTVVLLDRPWTPGDARQAEDRVRRIGQTALSIKSVWIAGFTIDDSLDTLLQTKDKNSEIVVSGGDISQSPSAWFDNDDTNMQAKCLTSSGKGKKTKSGVGAATNDGKGTISAYFPPSASTVTSAKSSGVSCSGVSTDSRASNQEDDQEVRYIWSSTDREEAPEVDNGSGSGGNSKGRKEDMSIMKNVLNSILALSK